VRFILLFLLVISIVLWAERLYWKKKARLMLVRLSGTEAAHPTTTFLEAWLENRIDSAIRKERRRNGAE
jgi:hypothetical protein